MTSSTLFPGPAAQALSIIGKFGDPGEADGIKALIRQKYTSLSDAIAAQEAAREARRSPETAPPTPS